MSASGMARAEGFSWERVTDRVEAYYGFVIRRLAAQGRCHLTSAPIPPSPRAGRQRPGRPASRLRRRSCAGPDRPFGATPADRCLGQLASPVDAIASRSRRAAACSAHESARSRRCSRRSGRSPTGTGTGRPGRDPAARPERGQEVEGARHRVGVDRELEGVQVGRQQALVGVDDRRGERQAGQVRIHTRNQMTQARIAPAANRRASRAVAITQATGVSARTTTSAIGSIRKPIWLTIAVSGRKAPTTSSPTTPIAAVRPIQRIRRSARRPLIVPARRAAGSGRSGSRRPRERTAARPADRQVSTNWPGAVARQACGARVHGRDPDEGTQWPLEQPHQGRPKDGERGRHPGQRPGPGRRLRCAARRRSRRGR